MARNTLTRRDFVRWSVMAAGATALAACSAPAPTEAPSAAPTAAPGSTTAPAKPTPAPVKGTLRVMTFFADNDPTVEKGVIAEFQKAFPDVKVDAEIISFGDLFTKLKTLIGGGNPPDVASLNFENLHAYVAEKSLAELDPFIQRDNYDMTQLFEASVNMHRVGGRQYGMPATFSDVVLYYNKNLFDKAGIPYPDKTWNLDKVLEVGKQLTVDQNKDGIIDQFAYVLPWFPICLAQYGGDVFNADKTKCALGEPAALEGLNMMTTFCVKEKIAPTRVDIANQGDADRFIAGTIAMLPTGPWMINKFQAEATSFDWDVADLPGGKKQATHTYGNSYAILAQAKNKDAAWEFLKVACGEVGGHIRQANGYELSPVKKVMENEFLKGLEGKKPKSAQVFLDAMNYAVLPPYHAHWSEIHDTAIWPELELALNGKQTMEDAVAKIVPAVDKMLAQFS